MIAACVVTVPFGLAAAGGNLFGGHVLAFGVLIEVLSSALPYMLEMKALERLTSHLFGLVTSSAPAIGALCGFLILGEQLTAVHWLAVILMIAASAGCSLSTKPAVGRPTDEPMI
jgi:inner membrane transporter RhtA